MLRPSMMPWVVRLTVLAMFALASGAGKKWEAG
jgi:hypothetical protein